MSEDAKEVLDFIDFSHMTTAEGNVRGDEPPEEQRSPTDARAERWKDAEALHQWRTPEAEHYLLCRDGRLYHRATFPAQTIEPTHVHAVVDVILAEEVLRLRHNSFSLAAKLGEEMAIVGRTLPALRIAQLEAELTTIHGIALAECDPDSREEDAALPTLEVVRHLAERAAQLCETNDVFHRTGLEAMQEADQLRAALAEKEAALAAAHEALKPFACEAEVWDACGAEDREIPLIRSSDEDEEPDYARFNVGDLRAAATALSAPTFQSAAKLDRLRREVVDAVEAVDRAEDEYTEAVGAMGEQSGGGRARALARRMDDARERRDAALAALRAEEEENA